MRLKYSKDFIPGQKAGKLRSSLNSCLFDSKTCAFCSKLCCHQLSYTDVVYLCKISLWPLVEQKSIGINQQQNQVVLLILMEKTMPSPSVSLLTGQMQLWIQVLVPGGVPTSPGAAEGSPYPRLSMTPCPPPDLPAAGLGPSVPPHSETLPATLIFLRFLRHTQLFCSGSLSHHLHGWKHSNHRYLLAQSYTWGISADVNFLK